MVFASRFSLELASDYFFLLIFVRFVDRFTFELRVETAGSSEADLTFAGLIIGFFEVNVVRFSFCSLRILFTTTDLAVAGAFKTFASCEDFVTVVLDLVGFRFFGRKNAFFAVALFRRLCFFSSALSAPSCAASSSSKDAFVVRS